MKSINAQAMLLALSIRTVLSQERFSFAPPAPFPRPPATGIGWEDAFAKAQHFVAQMTLDEKAQTVTGNEGPCSGNIPPLPRLGFGGLCLQDGPAGLGLSKTSSLPAGGTVAASWDRELLYERGLRMGKEFKDKGRHIALGPSVGPLGRNLRFSTDPYLSGAAVYQTVQGMQKSGVQSCIKHFALNEQETNRGGILNAYNVYLEAISENVDDRTFHELYLWPFAEAVHAGASSFMCSYNRINGSYACQNPHVLNAILKSELGFQGLVMSDWGGTHSGLAAIESGLHMNMPGGIAITEPTPSYWGQNLTIAVQNSSLPESTLDDMLHRILAPYFHLQQNVDYPPIDGESFVNPTIFHPPYAFNYTVGPSYVDVREPDSYEFSRKAAANSMVLLKNENNTLPLMRKISNIGLLGNAGGEVSPGPVQVFGTANPYGYENGMLIIGGGSATTRLARTQTYFEKLKARVLDENPAALVQIMSDNNILVLPPRAEFEGVTLTQGSGQLIPAPEVCIVFLKLWASENQDRLDVDPDWQGSTIVANVAAVCANTVVVVENAVIPYMPWADHPNVTAILFAGLAGDEAGNALVDILYGDVNPSGHLPFTIFQNSTDYPWDITNSTELFTTNDTNAWQSNFTEGLLTDYRFYDYHNKTPRYEFGFGLSYTTFNLSDLEVSIAANAIVSRYPTSTRIIPGGNAQLWDDVVSVQVNTCNNGSVAGSAVPQMYVSLPNQPDPHSPVRVLRGFDKVALSAGSCATSNMTLTRKDVSIWDVVAQQWYIPRGDIEIAIGLSSRDLHVSQTIKLL
ncbi:hypothetical protein IQ07DRAFT_640558 [Pyrenochaeta sp. DS3sAY3a]|nr:hypothetical protein IQ07DRAFT_640558 [Pyrenochaeta sp. DS3sAY3a]